MLKGFPKLFHIGDKNTLKIWDGPIEITEKVDGSQFNFGVVNGELKMRSKNAEVFLEDNNKMFNAAKQFAEDRFKQGMLAEGTIYHGEYLSTRRHNTLEYGRVPKGNIALYGVSLKYGVVSDWNDISYYAKWLGCDVVPLLWRGDGQDFKTRHVLDDLLKRESFLGGPEIEGIVVKNYTQFVMYGGSEAPVYAKYVSEKFKETHKVAWGSSNPSQLDRIASCFNATARWEKSIQHMRDEGTLTQSPKDIGPLLKAINIDIEQEEKENIKDMLYQAFRKDIMRIATAGFPEYYKAKLVEDSMREAA